jgi:mono/diheme cytochrome c family protein
MQMTIFLRATLSMAISLAAFAQTTAKSGAYTAAQATAGEAVYKTSCASCHGAELEGRGQMPALQGTDFVAAWKDMSLGLLFEKMQSSMPADKPGSLKFEDNAAILAFLLKRNGYPAGAAALPADPDALKKISWGK